MQFISSKVDIRFLPDDMSSAYILLTVDRQIYSMW